MPYIDIIGFIAGTLTTLSLLPQMIKSWKTKSTADVSFGWLIMLVSGAVLWEVYGFFIWSLPLIATNLATFILAILILILKLKHG